MIAIVSHIRRHRNTYSYLLTFVLIGLFIAYAVHNQASLGALRGISGKYILIIAILGLLYKVVLGLKFKIMINFFGIKAKPREWFGLSCLTSMINTLLPAHAGTATQAVYLKKNYNFKYSGFIGYLLNFLIFSLMVYSVCGIILLLLHKALYSIFFTAIFLFFIAVFILCIIFIFLIPKFSMIKFRWELLNKTIDGFKALKAKRSLVIRFVLIQTADVVITGLRLFFAYYALGAHVGLVPIFLVGLIASVSSIVNLTPANLGIRELFITASSILVGEGAMFGVMASVIDRVIGTLITFILGLISMYILLPSAKITIDKDRAAL